MGTGAGTESCLQDSTGWRRRHTRDSWNVREQMPWGRRLPRIRQYRSQGSDFQKNSR